MALAETANLAVKLDLQGNFDANLQKASRSLGSFNASVTNTVKKVGTDLGHGLRNAARNIERLGFAAAALAVGGGAAAVKWAGDFQAGMQTINTVAFATPEVLAKAGEGLRNTFRQTGQSMQDLQSAEYDLVSAGIQLKDAQTGVNAAVKLGIGALGSTGEAVDVLTTAINSYNLKAKDGSVATATWTKLSDELAQAVADGKVKLTEIAATYAMVAPVAAQAGVKTGEIAAALGYLTAKGNTAEATLTEMNRAIIELSKPKGDMATVLKSLGESGTQLIAEHGLAGALEIIRVRAEKLKIPFINLFGRVEAYKFALQTTGPNAAGFTAELDRIAHSAGMTSKQFDERAQGFNYQLGVLKANVQDAGITIGTALLPKLTELSQKAADFLRGHQGDIKAFANDLAKGFERAVTWASKLDWNAIGAAIKGLADFGKTLAKGFMAMPTEAKEILLGLYGLNKLSGGAVVNIGVDLTKGLGGTLLQQFLGRGSPANPMWVTSVGGVGSGSGGINIGLVSAIVAVALPIVALQVGDMLKPQGPGKFAPTPSILDILTNPFQPRDRFGYVPGDPNSPATKKPYTGIGPGLTGPLGTNTEGGAQRQMVTDLTNAFKARDLIRALNALPGRMNKALALPHAVEDIKRLVAYNEKDGAKPTNRIILSLEKANKIAQDGHRTTDQKLADLKRIEDDLRRHGDKTAQRYIERLEKTLRDKKLAVAVSVTNSISISDINAKASIRQTYSTGTHKYES